MQVWHWGRKSPICYILEQDPIQEALETKHQLTSFKLNLLSGSEMRMVRWASKTPEHFLIHVQGAIHAIKEMELDTKFQEAVRAVQSENLEVILSKMAYKDELKKWERDKPPQQAVELAMPRLIRPNISKRKRVMNPLKP